jgi:hypothetical protein
MSGQRSAGEPVVDAAWLRVLGVLASSGIGFHSLGISFEPGQGWRVTAVFGSVASMEQAGAALGLDLTESLPRVGLRRTGTILGLPVTCLCWTSKKKSAESAETTAPVKPGRAKTRGYVNAPVPGQLDLLDLAAMS